MSAIRVLLLAVVAGAVSFAAGTASRAASRPDALFAAYCTAVMPQCQAGTLPKCICADKECYWICN